jgi:hypothetical protein
MLTSTVLIYGKQSHMYRKTPRLSPVNPCAVVHKATFRLVGAPLTTQWLPSITFVKGEKNDEISINKYCTVNVTAHSAAQ